MTNVVCGGPVTYTIENVGAPGAQAVILSDTPPDACDVPGRQRRRHVGCWHRDLAQRQMERRRLGDVHR